MVGLGHAAVCRRHRIDGQPAACVCVIGIGRHQVRIRSIDIGVPVGLQRCFFPDARHAAFQVIAVLFDRIHPDIVLRFHIRPAAAHIAQRIVIVTRFGQVVFVIYPGHAVAVIVFRQHGARFLNRFPVLIQLYHLIGIARVIPIALFALAALHFRFIAAIVGNGGHRGAR